MNVILRTPSNYLISLSNLVATQDLEHEIIFHFKNKEIGFRLNDKKDIDAVRKFFASGHVFEGDQVRIIKL